MSDAQTALKEIRKYRCFLTAQQKRTLKGQALNGDASAALKGLYKLLMRVGVGSVYFE